MSIGLRGNSVQLSWRVGVGRAEVREGLCERERDRGVCV